MRGGDKGVLTVGSVGGSGRLANNDLVRVDTAGDDLKDGGLGPSARRSGQEAIALITMEEDKLVEKGQNIYDNGTHGSVLRCAL